MIIGDVMGSVWATRKDEKLNGLKLLIVKPIYNDDLASTFVAADLAGAGVGDTVLVTKGSSARSAFGKERLPIDSVIVGVVDSIDMIQDE
ncbi:EutN/CcmL family microcompartment protein [Oceanobacillus jeddahense]|uniref:EutN/CcmL family microcompartment protein n=1 Tax=Oceanobacillus jeddahense TaxID=1462527 RepID=UPI000595F9CE|nr:EutN/CcmL family microcompartment protein [Oceanobacillus jeddahense]